MSTPNLINTYYDLSKLVLWGDEPINESTTSKPRLVISFRDGNPRLTVYTGIQGGVGVIPFPCDYPTFMGVLELLEQVADGDKEKGYEVDSVGFKYVNNAATTEKEVRSTLHIGKSKEGIVYMSILAPEKPKVVFSIKLSDFHNVRVRGGGDMSADEISSRLTKGVVKILRGIMIRTIGEYTDQEYNSGLRQLGQIPGKAAGNSKPTNSVTATSSLELSDDIPF